MNCSDRFSPSKISANFQVHLKFNDSDSCQEKIDKMESATSGSSPNLQLAGPKGAQNCGD